MSGTLSISDNLALSLTKYDAIPVPADMAPDRKMDWSALTDDELMEVPPHVAVHMMRTGAQKGLQVISPRQIPSTNIVRRTEQTSTNPFVHIAGSDAVVNPVWPVPAGSVRPLEDDMDDEPISKAGEPLAFRTPARAEPLAVIDDAVASPIQKAWIKARSCVDLQSREDVHGDAETLAAAYEALYAAHKGSIGADPGLVASDAETLMDHAIVVDNKLARQLAPIQSRRVLTVAVGPSNAAAFGPDRGFDWTCARVVAETKYNLTASNEKLSLRQVSTSGATPIGALVHRPEARGKNVVVYHPTPGTTWSYAPNTFAVYPNAEKIVRRTMVSDLVKAELRAGAEFASPVAAALAFKASVAWVQTRVERNEYVPAATTSDAMEGYAETISRATVSMKSIAKTPDRALRAEVYTALTSADKLVMVKVVRALKTVTDTVDEVDGEIWMSDRVVSTLATRMVRLDAHINAHMAASAAIRGEDVESWFHTLRSQMPDELMGERLGTKGWAKIAVRMMAFPPSDKWKGLVTAAKVSTINVMEPSVKFSGVTAVGEDGEHFAPMRARMKAVVDANKKAFAASYDGAALGCTLCARMAEDTNLPRLAKLFRISAAGWTLRQRFLSRVYITIGPETTAVPDNAAAWHSKAAGLHHIPPVTVLTRVAPQKVYADWSKCVAQLLPVGSTPPPKEVTVGMISYAVRMAPPVRPNIMDVDYDIASAIIAKPGDAFRFAVDPTTLASALERNLDLLTKDAVDVVVAYNNEVGQTEGPVIEPQPAPNIGKALASSTVDTMYLEEMIAEKDAPGNVRNGWSWLSDINAEDSAYMSEQIDTVDGMKDFMDEQFATLQEFEELFDAKVDAEKSGMEYVDDALA